MDLEREIDIYLRARFTLVHVVSHEEDRVLDQLKRLCERSNRTLFVWDHADYFKRLTGKANDPDPAKEPLSALAAIDKAAGECVFVLRDFHQCWHNQPRVIRKLRNVIRALKYTRKTIIVTAPTPTVPEELKDDAVIIDLPPPGYDDLSRILDHLAQTPGVRSDLNEETRGRIINLALGLSSAQAQRVFSKAIVTDGAINEHDLDLIAEEKREIIRDSGALEYYTSSESINDVGGLEVLKDWLRVRELAFRDDAKAYGLPAPKGIALIGIPGTGKSLTAKMIASLWHMPLIRMDVGALFGGLVGESEENTRRALRLAEAVAPCILWIDELEKALSVGEGDGGTGMRVLGKLLSWMQDKTRPVFIVATANDIERLPPELLRRGRFDEIFFLDLPNATERKAIFEVHIRKRGRHPASFDLGRIARAADGYVGAEIEQAVIDAMYLAFSDRDRPGREFTDADILVALERLVPMSQSQRERIQYLRSWVLEGRAQSASLKDRSDGVVDTVPLQLRPELPTDGIRPAV
jgi:AAA+ superfamily predicted ATPase